MSMKPRPDPVLEKREKDHTLGYDTITGTCRVCERENLPVFDYNFKTGGLCKVCKDARDADEQ